MNEPKLYYRVGELSKIIGVPISTIHYYTRLGLLKDRRTKSNYRIYDRGQIERFKRIQELKAQRLTLHEIKRELGV